MGEVGGKGRGFLEENLRALARAGSDLADRLCWPARSAHVEQDAQGTWLRKSMPFSLGPHELAADPARVTDRDTIGLLGVGLGEQLEPLLARAEIGRVFAWERDPWLLRSALSLRDLRTPLESGRLRLGLGSDLVEWLEQNPGLPFMHHPRLGGIYRAEAELVRHRANGPRIALGLDQLLVDEVAAALRAQGQVVCPFDFESWSLEELDRAARRLRPRAVVSINHVPDLVRFCGERGMAYVCWEIDPTTERSPLSAPDTRHCSVWTYRRSHVPLFRRAGFSRTAWLPLASDPERPRPLDGNAPHASTDLKVAFVGSSLAPEARRARKRLLALFERWHPDGKAAHAEAERRLGRVLARQSREPTGDLLEEAMREELGEFVAHVRHSDEREDPVALAGQLAAAERRRQYVAGLRSIGVDIWGDPGWRAIEGPGVRYHGYAGRHHGLHSVYSTARINVDIGRLYQSDIVTLRVFDVLACGGFVLAEHSADLEALFEVGKEVESYRGPDELLEKVTYYLAHPEARAAIAARGRRAILDRHTVRHRVRRLLEGLPPTPR